MNAKIQKRLQKFMSTELMNNVEVITTKVEILDFIRKNGEIIKVSLTFDKEVAEDVDTLTMGFDKYSTLLSIIGVKDIDIENKEVELAVFHDAIGEEIYTPASGGTMISTVDNVVYIVDIK